MHTQFDLFEQPFVPWRIANGLPERVGLREALKRAGELTPFGDAGPQTMFAVVRLLLVLMHWTRSKCEPDERDQLWDSGRFPTDWLKEMEDAARSKFHLFNTDRPFLQTATVSEKTRPVSDLIAELPTDTNINHVRHVYDSRVALCPACCGLGILRLAPFCGQGGQGKAPSINAPPPAYLLPVGDTLFHTLLLNWPLADPVDGDRPAWEGRDGGGQDRIGLLEGFTWEPRSVRLIADDGRGESCTLCGRMEPQMVRRIVFQKGRDRSGQRVKAWRDPHVAYAEDASTKGTSKKEPKRVRTLIPPEPVQDTDAASGFWRAVVVALLRSGHDDDSAFSCAAVAAARRFRLSDDLAVLVVATHTRQAKVLHDRLDLWTLPPLDPERDQLLTGECDWLAEGLNRLERGQKKAGPEKPPEISHRDEFERQAARHFRELLAHQGKGIADWRAAVLRDLRTLAQPVAMPGRALERQRAVVAIERAINTCFPGPEETP